MQRPWFMSAPYGNWQKSILSLVVCYAQHGRNYSYIIRKFQIMALKMAGLMKLSSLLNMQLTLLWGM